MQNTLLQQIYNSRQNVLKIMKTNGYENIEDYSNFSINEVSIMIQNNQLDMLLYKNKNQNQTDNQAENQTDKDKIEKKIYICYFLEKQLNIQAIKQIVDDLFLLESPPTLSKNNDILYIITNESIGEKFTSVPYPSDNIRNGLMHFWEKDHIFIVVESLKRLQFNILEHSLVFPHIILSPSELDTLLKQKNIKNLCDLPEISRFDSVARAICILPSEVCKIIRTSKTGISAPYYRLCVNLSGDY